MAHNDEGAKIFVGGIGETGEDELKNYFGQYGNVKAVQVKYDPTTQRARGFGFIIFDDMSSVDSVMSAVPHALQSGQKIDAKRIEVPQELFKIFIGGIPQGFTEDAMRDYFSRYGAIEVIEWPKGPQGPKNFCFIKFDALATVKEICKHPKHLLGGQECDVKQCAPQNAAGGRGGRGGGDRGGFGGDRGGGRGFGGGRGRGDFGGGRGRGDFGGGRGGDRGARGGRGGDRGGRGGRGGGFQNGSDRGGGGFRGGRGGGDRGGRGGFDRGRGGDRGGRGSFGMGRGSPRGAPRGAPAFNSVQYGQPQPQLVPHMPQAPAPTAAAAPPAANPYGAYQDPNAYAAAYGQTYDYSQQAHLAAAQPTAIQPIQAAQPAPAAAIPQPPPQYDYSAYAGYAHAQQAAAVPAAAAAAVAHQPSPVPTTGYNAYGQPLQAAAPAQPAPTNGYHQPQPAVSAYQQYDQSAYAGYPAYQ